MFGDVDPAAVPARPAEIVVAAVLTVQRVPGVREVDDFPVRVGRREGGSKHAAPIQLPNAGSG